MTLLLYSVVGKRERKQMLTIWGVARRTLAAHARIFTLFGGAAAVAVWTVFRHITNGVNFDVVGQVGIADQWVHGVRGAVTLGQTNYVLKMPLYMLADALHFLSPMNRLVFFALLFNIATFIAIFFLVEKFLDLEGVRDRRWFYVAALWFATIAGGVFWMDYANSRNLETVGGLLLIYLVASYIRKPRLRTAVLLAAVGVVVGFADPLQLFICGGGVLLYAAARLIRAPSIENKRFFFTMLAAIGVAYIGGKVLSLLTKLLLHIHYLAVPGTPQARNLSALWQGVQAILDGTLKIFDADVFKSVIGPNSVRQLINLVILLAIIGLLVKYFAEHGAKKPLAWLLLSVIAADFVAYIASGQVLTPNTSRYLIMVPIMTLVFVAVHAPSIRLSRAAHVQYAWGTLAVLSVVVLLGGVVKSWPERHVKDEHIYQTIAFLQTNHYPYALGWHDLGVTTTYFSQDDTVVLPVSCAANGTLKEISLFYDKGEFGRLKKYSGDVPFIVSADTSSLERCDAQKLTAMFGRPKSELPIPGVGMAEIYSAASLDPSL